MNGSIQWSGVKTTWKKTNLPDIVSEIQVGKLFQGEKAVESAIVSGVDGLPRHYVTPAKKKWFDWSNFCDFCQKNVTVTRSKTRVNVGIKGWFAMQDELLHFEFFVDLREPFSSFNYLGILCSFSKEQLFLDKNAQMNENVMNKSISKMEPFTQVGHYTHAKYGKISSTYFI